MNNPTVRDLTVMSDEALKIYLDRMAHYSRRLIDLWYNHPTIDEREAHLFQLSERCKNEQYRAFGETMRRERGRVTRLVVAW